MKKLQKIIKKECSKMSGIPEKDIHDETSFDSILFPLTQKLDAIFRVGAISNGVYESSTFADIVKHYEKYDLPEI